MLDRIQLQKLAKLRIKEAQVLIKNNRFDGAYYLLGYSVECALKACIAKQTRRYEFPEKQRGLDSYTHNLENLLKVSGLLSPHIQETKVNKAFEVNWGQVKDWKVDSRYLNGIEAKKANDYLKAVTDRKNGVLTWIKKFW